MELHEEIVVLFILSCVTAIVMFTLDIVPVKPDSGISNLEYRSMEIKSWW